MYKPGLRILQLVRRALNQEAGISGPDGVKWDWQHGTHTADPARPRTALPTTLVKGKTLRAHLRAHYVPVKGRMARN